MHQDSVADYEVYENRWHIDPDPELKLNEMIDQLNKEENDDFQELVKHLLWSKGSRKYTPLKRMRKLSCGFWAAFWVKLPTF